VSTRRGEREPSRRDQHERFDAVYAATRRDLLAFLLRRASTPDDAADLLAQTFLIAWEKRDRVPGALEDARPWLFAIARNLLRHSLERSGRSRSLSITLAEELRRLGVEEPPPAARVGPAEDPVLAALAQLAAIDREIIELASWDGLTPREIAPILGLSPNVVRVRAHRARARLKALLQTERVTNT
jgi:RNA polymerase sigma-70 factor (ECF subfamily)